MLPNILYLHSHDTGRMISPYGYAVRTPHFARLAAESVVFRNAHTVAPTCSPSRAALLTGQWAHCAGMLGLAHRGWKLHDYGRHLVSTLKAHGYHTALSGVQHVAAGPESVATIGYHECLCGSGRARDVAPAAAAWLDAVGLDAVGLDPVGLDAVHQDARDQEASPASPWFLDVGFVETHTLPGDGTYGNGLFNCGLGDPATARMPATLPDNPATRQDWADYRESVARLDEGIGIVLDALERSGQAGNTIVLCTTDHGIPFPRMKCNLTDAGTGVLLMLRAPGVEPGVSDALVSHLEMFPTLCEMLGIAPPPWLQGHSLLPILRGETAEVREELFAEVTHHASYEPARSVRTGRWKYIRHFGTRTLPVACNIDDSRSKDWLAREGWLQREIPREELFDLSLDPGETGNLAADSRWQEVLQDMRARLERWMEETADPLLHGDIPVPAGTMEKNPDAYSPRDNPPSSVPPQPELQSE